jgi:hypothetical protein
MACCHSTEIFLNRQDKQEEKRVGTVDLKGLRQRFHVCMLNIGLLLDAYQGHPTAYLYLAFDTL